MQKKESKWQIVFNKYLRQERGLNYGFYELKDAAGEYFNYKNFEDHQIESLTSLRWSGLVWKLSDADPRQKPCDTMCVPPLPAYVVIKYPKFFAVITVEDFVADRDARKRKSLSYQQALSIATRIIHI